MTTWTSKRYMIKAENTNCRLMSHGNYRWPDQHAECFSRPPRQSLIR